MWFCRIKASSGSEALAAITPRHLSVHTDHDVASIRRENWRGDREREAKQSRPYAVFLHRFTLWLVK